MSRSSKSTPQNPASRPTVATAQAGRVPSNQAASAAGAAGPLGIKRKNVDEFEREAREKKRKARELRRERWADQRQAASIYKRKAKADGIDLKSIKGRGVTLCGWTQVASQGGAKLMMVDPGNDQDARAFWQGLHKCGGTWNCPVCTHAKAEKARISLNLGLAAARRLGLSPVMMTLTARHDRDMSLSDFWGALGQAERELKKSEPWKLLCGKPTKKNPHRPMRRGGFAKAIEVTRSDEAGWHPHAHIICLLDLSEELAIAAVETLRDEWLHQLNRVGLDGTSAAARRHAFDVQGAAEAGNYVAKWGAAEEMTGGAKKEAKGNSRSLWQLLRDARTGETKQERQAAEDLWYEGVRVMAGTHQLRMSPAFKKLVEEERERTPSATEELPEATEVWGCDLEKRDPTWTHMRHRRLRAIEAAERAGIESAYQAVQEVLMSIETDASDVSDDIDLIDDDDPLENMWTEPERGQRDASPWTTMRGAGEQEARQHGDGREDEEGEAARTLEGGGLGRASGPSCEGASASGERFRGVPAAAVAADRSASARSDRQDRC